MKRSQLKLGDDVTNQHFQNQLRFVRRWFRIVSLPEAITLLEEKTLSEDCVVITFDDGYLDNYTVAFPLLRRFNAPATVFLIAGLVGTSEFPWYDKCREHLISLEGRDLTPVATKRLKPIVARLHRMMTGYANMNRRIESAIDFLKTLDNVSRD